MYLETNFPNGCINNYTDTASNCANNGLTWWVPATTQQQCEVVKGILFNHKYLRI